MKKSSSIYSLFLTLFNDSLNLGLVIVIFAPMLIGPNAIMLQGSTLATQTLVLGFLLGAFPFAQFFTSPCFGAISDALGRRKTLLISIGGCAIFNSLAAISIHIKSLPLLFIARLLSGASAGNQPLATASIADLSTPENKTKNFSIIGILGSAAWALGAPIGGILANDHIVPWFGFSVTFWFAAVLFFINFIWLFIAFRETYEIKNSADTNIKKELQNLSRVFHIPFMAVPMICIFLFYYGWFSYIYFYAPNFVHRFGFDQTEIGYFTAYLALCFFVASHHVKRLSKKYSDAKIVCIGLLMSGGCLLISSFISTFWIIFIFYTIICYFCAYVWVPALALISNIGGEKNQGKVFGVQQALLSLGILLAPIISGAIAIIDLNAPFAMAGISLLLSLCILYLFFYRSYQKQKVK